MLPQIVVVILFLVRSVTSDECGQVFTGSFGTITSPNYPMAYEVNLQCDFLIMTPDNTTIRLSFRDFELEDVDCKYDHLSVYDGQNYTDHLLGNFCGSERPPDIFSSSNSMYLVMETDSSVEYRGFFADYIVQHVTPPQNVIARGLSSSAVHVQWQRPAQVEGELYNYTITMQSLASHRSPAQGCPALPSQHSVVTTVRENTTEVDIHYLPPATEFQVIVTALTTLYGYQSTSAPVLVSTFPAASGPVRNLTVDFSAKMDTMTLRWEGPCDSGGDLRYFLVMLNTAPPATNHSLPQTYVSILEIENSILTEYYSISVPVANLSGETVYTAIVTPVGLNYIHGENSSMIFHVSAQLPSQPRVVRAITVSSTGVRVKWQPPEKTGGSIHNYTVTLTFLQTKHLPASGCPPDPPPHNTVTVAVNGSTLESDVNYLPADTEFHVTVSAATAAGRGPLSNPIPITTFARAPGSVRYLTVVVKENQTSFRWKPPCHLGGALSHFLVDVEATSQLDRQNKYTWSLFAAQPLDKSYNFSIPTSSLTEEGPHRVSVTPVGVSGLHGIKCTVTFQAPAPSKMGVVMTVLVIIAGVVIGGLLLFFIFKRINSNSERNPDSAQVQQTVRKEIVLDDTLRSCQVLQYNPDTGDGFVTDTL